MEHKIKIGIVGYGNLGRGVESAVTRSSDMELIALLTRRDPATVKTATGIPTYSMDAASTLRGKVDVMILCGGSANDLPTQTPAMAKYFNVIDSFDTHAKIRRKTCVGKIERSKREIRRACGRKQSECRARVIRKKSAFF